MKKKQMIVFSSQSEGEKRCFIPKRYIVVCMAFFGLFNAYCMRVNVSVAIVAMVNHTAEKSYSNNSRPIVECSALIDENEPIQENLKGERYNWDASQQGFILSAFFYGYFLAMLPGGYLAERLGAVRIFGACILSTALLTLLTPVVVKWGLTPFLVLRFLEGIGEGATYPSVVAIIGRWAPKLERSRITSIIFTGAPLGSVFSFILSGYLSSSDFLGGWPSVFYVFGAIACVWFTIWTIYIYESPDLHPTIEKDELLEFKDSSSTTHGNKKIPWKAITTSIPVWATALTNFGHMFGFNIMNTEIPTYLNSILHFNIKASGWLSSLPNICDAIGAWVGAFIADKLRSSERCKITTIRKLCNSLGGFGPSLCLVGVALAGCNSFLIIVLLSFGMFMNGFRYSGYTAAVVDMTPDFAGVIYGLTNGLGNLSGVVAPTIVGEILSNGATVSNWSLAFLITAGIYFLTTAVYAFLGSADLQSWGVTKLKSEKKDAM